MIPTLRVLVCIASVCATLATAVPAAAAGDNPHASAFVTLYRCDADRWIAVAYPAPSERAREPVRLAWQERTLLLGQARSASGARYVSKAADLEWWTHGRAATLRRLSARSVLASGCTET